jgi:hypothetical protein
LLSILFSEVRPLGTSEVEQLQHYSGDAAKMTWPMCAAKVLGNNRYIDISKWLTRVHLFDRWSKHYIDAVFSTEFEIGIQIARISLEILLTIELKRVHENCCNDYVIVKARAIKQGRVSRMQRSHGGHETDG